MTTRAHVGTTWPSATQVDAVTLRLSKDKTAFEMALHAAANCLKSGGKLWVYGANDEGIKSAHRRIDTVFSATTTLISRKHCRVVQARRPEHIEGLKPALADWMRRTPLDFEHGRVEQISYPGVFAKGLLDGGTRLLLSALPTPPPGSRVLDFASGSGVIALALRERESTLSFTLVDADAICATAAQQNLPQATVHTAACLGQLPLAAPFDIIVANPPYHDGKARSHTVIQELIASAPEKMAEGAALWLVAQKQVNVKPWLVASHDSPEVMAENGRFRVWRAMRPKNR